MNKCLTCGVNKTTRPVFKSYKSLETHIALVTQGMAYSMSRLVLAS